MICPFNVLVSRDQRPKPSDIKFSIKILFSTSEKMAVPIFQLGFRYFKFQLSICWTNRSNKNYSLRKKSFQCCNRVASGLCWYFGPWKVNSFTTLATSGRTCNLREFEICNRTKTYMLWSSNCCKKENDTQYLDIDCFQTSSSLP